MFEVVVIGHRAEIFVENNDMKWIGKVQRTAIFVAGYVMD
jgi:hypothetical protein